MKVQCVIEVTSRAYISQFEAFNLFSTENKSVKDCLQWEDCLYLHVIYHDSPQIGAEVELSEAVEVNGEEFGVFFKGKVVYISNIVSY